MKINIVLPFFSNNPGGGLKVMYQYANELAARGHSVYIYHAMYTRYMPGGGQGFRKKKNRFFQHILRLNRRKRPDWFKLNADIKSFEIVDISNDLIRNANVTFSTWWATALEVYNLKASKGRKFNLIQDAETVMNSDADLVYTSYKLPIQHIVIAHYLKGLVFNHSGIVPEVIPNAIDPAEFFVKNDMIERYPSSVIMLYSDATRKGTAFGIAALKLVLQKYPQLKVTLFGVLKDVNGKLPDKFTYYHRPDNLNELYNQNAIFVSPSVNEGWGLPAMEAMACGCACVCTNIEGHLDFTENGKTAILVPPANSEMFAGAVIKLIKDQQLRVKIAEAAIDNVKNYSWKKSADRLEQLFNGY